MADKQPRCSKCKKTFKNEAYLKSHKTQRNKGCLFRESEEEPFTCMFCGHKTENGWSMVTHYLRNHTMYDKDSNFLPAEKHPKGEEYKKMAEKYLSPFMCQYAFASAEEGGKTAAMVKWNTSPLSSKDRKCVFICEACDFASTSVMEMRGHRWNHAVEGELEGGTDVHARGGDDPRRPADIYAAFFKSKGEKAAAANHQEASDRGREASRRALNRKLALLRSAHNGKFKLFRYIFPETVTFPDSAFINITPEIVRVLKKELVLNSANCIKTSACLFIEMIKLDEYLNITDEAVIPFRSSMEVLYSSEDRDIYQLIAYFKNKIESSIEKFTNSGSGWTIR